LRVSLLARGYGENACAFPAYSFAFPAPITGPVDGVRTSSGPMKFRTAYSDELASDSHGIPRYAKVGVGPILRSLQSRTGKY
jgi:hypothetical protein